MTPTFVPSSGRAMRPLDKILLPYYDDAGNYIDSDLPCVFEDRPMPVPLFTPFSDGDYLNTCCGWIVSKTMMSYAAILGIRLFALLNGLTIQGGRNYPIARGDDLNARLTFSYKHDRYSREDTSVWVNGLSPQEG